MKKLYYTFLCLGLVTITSCSSGDSVREAANQSVLQFEQAGVPNMENDALFVAETASALMLQEQLAQAASDKAVSPEVKGLSGQMKEEHNQMLSDLQELATAGNFVLPSSLGNAQQDVYNEVTQKDGIAFDLTYIKAMVEQHEKLLKRYKDMVDNAQMMQVKQYASKQVPLIRQHLETADRLAESLENI